MPAAIDPVIKQRVIAQYLQGVSRDTIAADNGIGTGTVSNIIDECKKRCRIQTMSRSENYRSFIRSRESL
jgi:DNA-directed RNA polymerase specialized sigma24 family protein